MNVSITEDATMSRTRLETGATVVRVDAIVEVPAQKPALQEKGYITACPSVSLSLNYIRVNTN
jgi:hypothetical protein